MVIVEAFIVTGFVLVHLFAGKLRFLEGIPRSRWLSLAGGISVAYVFVHVLPELAEAQHSIGEQWQVFQWVEHHAYVVALFGLVVFYGLERLVKSSRGRRGEPPQTGEGEAKKSVGLFWLHIFSFAIYNALIGFLLVHREEQDIRGLLFFSVAMAVHFLVNDYGLRQDHKDTYRSAGRWMLASAVLVGWFVGLATNISTTAIDVFFAFLAGGVVLNVLKEELPEERESRFSSFLLGAAAYTVLLLL
jgi:zinc transporter ZupT